MKTILQRILLVLGIVLFAQAHLHAQATLLLEEPYSYDGAFAGTGHSAVYLSRVCAATPLRLRRCSPGELGAVISRYHGLAGHDWVAIPLVSYLYAVEKPSDIPLVADSKMVAFLRHEYLPHLKLIADPASPDGKPVGPWYELIGSAYDRTLYGFQIATTPQQDDALIRQLNNSPNLETYTLLRRNCADFSKQLINFYYPHATHRSIIADLGVTTPKQVAKTLVHYSKHHPNTELTTFVIPQVPGTRRSRRVRGVLESALFSKKYMALLLVLHPIAVGSVEMAYLSHWHFDPSRTTTLFDPSHGFEAPLSNEARREYQQGLEALLSTSGDAELFHNWSEVEAHAVPRLEEGCPAFAVEKDGLNVEANVCRDHRALRGSDARLLEQLMIFRLDSELKSGHPVRASERQVQSDWTVLQKAISREPEQVAGEIN